MGSFAGMSAPAPLAGGADGVPLEPLLAGDADGVPARRAASVASEHARGAISGRTRVSCESRAPRSMFHVKHSGGPALAEHHHRAAPFRELDSGLQTQSRIERLCDSSLSQDRPLTVMYAPPGARSLSASGRMLASRPAAFDMTRSNAPPSLQFAASPPNHRNTLEAELCHDPLEKKLRLEPPLEERQVEPRPHDLPYEPRKSCAGAYIGHSSRCDPASSAAFSSARESNTRSSSWSRSAPCRRDASWRSRNPPLAGKARAVAAPRGLRCRIPPGRARLPRFLPFPYRSYNSDPPGASRARPAPAFPDGS